jgi:hypothetical protein
LAAKEKSTIEQDEIAREKGEAKSNADTAKLLGWMERDSERWREKGGKGWVWKRMREGMVRESEGKVRRKGLGWEGEGRQIHRNKESKSESIYWAKW